jgi:hypothetical protein
VNQIEHVDLLLFSELISLNTVYLDYNRIRLINLETFIGDNLTYVDLRWNQITSITDTGNISGKLKVLLTVDLSGNGITFKKMNAINKSNNLIRLIMN